MLATVAVGNVVAVHDTESNTAPVAVLLAGLVLAAAGVYALLRAAPPPARR